MRLRNPATGTVVRVEGDLADSMTAQGWVNADQPVQQAIKPAARRRPVKKSE